MKIYIAWYIAFVRHFHNYLMYIPHNHLVKKYCIMWESILTLKSKWPGLHPGSPAS